MSKKNRKSQETPRCGRTFAEQLSPKFGSPAQNEGGKSKMSSKKSDSYSNEYPAEVIGEPFFNPYTFIPFPDKAADRARASLLTADERIERVDSQSENIDKDKKNQNRRRSGILELEVKTISPLLTQEATPYKKVISDNGKYEEYPYPFSKKVPEQAGHLFFKALRIGNDVIVPATSIRGSLRTLMTILTGGTLGYIDPDLKSNLRDRIPAHVKPDCIMKDGKVDMVTDLFGQVAMDGVETVSFTGRIRPHNLIFFDGAENLVKNEATLVPLSSLHPVSTKKSSYRGTNEITLAPLSSPHPDCIPFYRENMNGKYDKTSSLRGYKVYRNSNEKEGDAPWLFKNQGIYNNKNLLENNVYQNVNKTVELLKAGVTGKLKIGFRALSDKELALLVAACTVDWKLGGGKPLGLGHCRVIKCRAISEEGDTIFSLEPALPNVALPEELKPHISSRINERINAYQKSQQPVPGTLRYPRAVDKNNRCGYVWFNRYSSVKNRKESDSNYLKNIAVAPALKEQLKQKYGDKNYIAAQPLPVEYDKPLYGYDCFTVTNEDKLVEKIERSYPVHDITGSINSGGSKGQNPE